MWIIYHTIALFLLAFLVWAVGRCFRLGPAARHALWLLVLFKLLLPPLFLWSLPVLPSDPPEKVFDNESTSILITEETTPIIEEPPAGIVENAIGEAELTTLASPQRKREINSPLLALPAAEVSLGAMWLFGAVVAAMLHGRRFVYLRRWLAHGKPASPRLIAIVRALAPLLGVRPPRVRVLSGLASPLVSSAGHVCLLWPEGLEEQLSPEGVRDVLAHELAHLARRDHWTAWLILVAGCVWWWHPLFYLIRRQLNRLAELACDARVISALPDDRRSYAEALLDVCQRQAALAAAPALGVAGRRRDLERRLTMILCGKEPSRLTLRMGVGIAFLGLIVLPAWTLGQVKTTDKTEGKATKTSPAEPKGQPFYTIVEIDKDPPADREKKLRELEAKLQALIKEVQALRSNKATTKPNAAKSAKWKVEKVAEVRDVVMAFEVKTPTPAEVTLSRTRYSLPAAQAEALSKFLQEHVKTPVIETKADGDSLTVTTTPEVQRSIGQFIALIGGKAPPWPPLSRPSSSYLAK